MINLTEKQILKGGNVHIRPIYEPSLVIYFLINSGEVIYVGQTSNLDLRVKTHKADKEFDTVSYLLVPSELACDYEAKYIVELKPKLNKSIPQNSKYVNLKMCIKRTIDDLREDLTEVIEGSALDFVLFRKGKCTLDKREVKYVDKSIEVEISEILNRHIAEIKEELSKLGESK